MIPRFKPYLSGHELLAMFTRDSRAYLNYCSTFATVFGNRFGFGFSYGRSALWVFFKVLGIKNAEVILPAYTCAVVGHAIILSGNIPRFVDINLCDYNMNLNQLEETISEKTRAVIATHLFGYPLDIERLANIVHEAEARYGHKIWVIQDCAHSFGAKWRGKLVSSAPDVALFGLNISKLMTSIFGGMLITNDETLAQALEGWCADNLHRVRTLKTLRRGGYLLASEIIFNKLVYRIVNWIESTTPLLDYFTIAYHKDDKIHFPPDFLDQMLPIEARVGLIQLRKYEAIIQRRIENAKYYADHLDGLTGWVLPPIIEGATYSHYVIRVPDRKIIMKAAQEHGIQLGQLIEYSLPVSPPYRIYTQGQYFPNAYLCSQSTINLPIYTSMSDKERAKVVRVILSIYSQYNQQ